MAEIEPREYQLELVDYVTKRNGIIYLPTGSGKTYVAILALKRFSSSCQETIENGGKRAILMCNTVELARQQALCVKKLTNLKIGFYVGERDVDNWKHSQWVDDIRENQVLIGTAQIFLNIIQQNYLKISDLSIVIIDECHHGTGKHPMHEFMRLFQMADQTQLPRVIGLTGVLIKGNENPSTVQTRLKELEITYRGNIITVSDDEKSKNVMLFSTKPQESLVLFKQATYNFNVVDLIKARITEYYGILDKMILGNVPPKFSKNLQAQREPNKKSFVKNTFNDFLYQMNDFGLYAASIAIVSILIEFELKKRQAETIALRQMYRSAINLCENIRHIILRKLSDLLDTDDVSNDKLHSKEIMLNFSTPKLLALFQYIEQTFSGKKSEDICCLLFVERRHTAKVIYGAVQKFIDCTPSLEKSLFPQFMVARNSIKMDFEGILERKWNKTALEQLRDGTCNMIICSNVLEEGIDLQACNYVIAFDQLKTFNSYVQTKGRARSKDSKYIMFIPELDKAKCSMQIKQYQEMNETIRRYLQDRILERNDPRTDEIVNHFDDILKPFVIPSGAALLPSCALTLVHRYCQTLPSDSFGVVLPWFNLLTSEEKAKSHPLHMSRHIVALTLPLTSKLRSKIYSDPMQSTRMAKVSAAFKTCIKLYELGELNDKLLPITIREQVDNLADEHFYKFKQFDDNANAKKLNEDLTRNYESKCPDEFYDAMPRVGEVCFAYQLQFRPNFEENEYNKHIYNALQTSDTHALLLRKRLPRLAEMPLFLNQGQLHVKVLHEPIEVRIQSQEDLTKLQMYHVMLFRDLINIWHSYFVMDKRSLQYSYLIAPISAGKELDWNLVSRFQRLSQCRPLTTVERGHMSFKPEDYIGKVVTQWYANFEHKRFIVTNVDTQRTPKSQMDSCGQTFGQFTIAKYGNTIGDIVHGDQFLIEVRELTSRINFFINAKGKSQGLKKNRERVFLIPELCHNFKYPGAMWIKAMFLPCVLHRLKYMLHGEHLRVHINKYLELDTKPYNGVAYDPKPLFVDESLRRNFDDVGNAIAPNECDEPKSVLGPMPTVQHLEVQMEKLDLCSFKAPWQDYMEPCDHNRQILSIFPVELSYYYKFTTGQVGKMDKYFKETEELWTNNQCKMSKMPINYGNNTPRQPNLSAIEGGPSMSDPSTIDILARSLGVIELLPAEQAELTAALTTAGASDVFDMERFEVLGDSFLKFSTTLFLANKYPLWNEGILTTVKSKMVSNRNLLYCLYDTDIPQRICKSIFQPKYSWLPPSASLPYNVLSLWQQDPALAKQIGVHNLHEIVLTEENVITTGECELEQYHSFVNSCKQNAKSAYANFNFDNEINCFVHREQIRDKVVADTLEALLGVCVKNYGIHNSFRMLEYFGIVKPDPKNPLMNLLDLKLGSDALRANIGTADVDGFLTNYKYLERNLGYTFRDRAYLLQALTHPSFPTNRITGCYQELEFIGDAILDFLISTYIFERQTRMTPGELTDLRSALVNNTTLACICVRHRFHLFILAENSMLSESIKNFAEFQETQQHRVTDQVRILAEEDDARRQWGNSENNSPTAEADATANGIPTVKRQYNLSVNVDVPKALGDIVEALIAAIFLDSRDLQETWRVIYKLFEPELHAFSANIPKNPLRTLHEHKYAKPKFSTPTIDNDTVMVSCEFTCLEKSITVHGFGSNSRLAKLSAAKHALQKLAKHEAK